MFRRDSTDYADQREQMVRRQLEARGIEDEAVLRAMRTVPRHEFVPAGDRTLAYADQPLSIGAGQTISQPFIVALMTELLHVRRGARVLEVGCGSGYQAAVFDEMGCEVFALEVVPELVRRATERLRRLGYTKVRVRCADGFQGWPEEGPYDGIILTCAPSEIPSPLLEQLASGARLVAPVGSPSGTQWLTVAGRTADGIQTRRVEPVRFVPMTGNGQTR